MKIFLATIAFFFICQQADAQQTTSAQISKLKWLAGTWNRTNPKPGKSGHESWKAEGNELKGYEVTMRGADTVLFEKVRIVEKDGSLFYLADVPENKSEVSFRMTKATDDEFVAENPEHDFPKRIHYQRTGASLKAVISGDGKSVEFLFEKAN